MKVGVPRETKVHEGRVGLTPAGVQRLVAGGHDVLVEREAGAVAGFSDPAYEQAGARLVKEAAEVWAEADLVVKVHRPLEGEGSRVRKGQALLCFLHLAAERERTEEALESGAFWFAYETLALGKTLPLLTPMSEVAGRMSIQVGAQWLEGSRGGPGILLGGVPGVERGHVLVLGGGVVGTQAARTACGLGADVTLMDVNLDRLRYLDEVLPRNCQLIYSTPLAVREALPRADLVIGAVLIPGGRTPKLVRREDLQGMKPGSVIVDLSVDQGGCVETSKPTTLAEPVFVVDRITHYCVTNVPGAVPRTSTFALTNATLPWIMQLAQLGPAKAILQSQALASAANVVAGRVTHPAVARAHELEHVEPKLAVEALG